MRSPTGTYGGSSVGSSSCRRPGVLIDAQQLASGRPLLVDLAEDGAEYYYSLLSIIEQVMSQGRTEEFLEVIGTTMGIEAEV